MLWARSFWAFSPFLNHLQKVQKVKKRKPARRKKERLTGLRLWLYN